MVRSLNQLLAYALTGDELAGEPGVEEDFWDWLAQAGWSADRIRAQAGQRWASEQVWPHQPPREALASIGAAAWHARLQAAKTALGLTVVTAPPTRRTVLTADERRLLAEVPPHHGPIG